MVRELGALFDSLRGDRSVGAVVITGKPEGLYITHYDVGEILASVERAGIAAPAVADLDRASHRRRAAEGAHRCGTSPSARRWQRCSSSTGSTTCSSR